MRIGPRLPVVVGVGLPTGQPPRSAVGLPPEQGTDAEPDRVVGVDRAGTTDFETSRLMFAPAKDSTLE